MEANHRPGAAGQTSGPVRGLVNLRRDKHAPLTLCANCGCQRYGACGCRKKGQKGETR